jgi:hypothetical protein
VRPCLKSSTCSSTSSTSSSSSSSTQLSWLQCSRPFCCCWKAAASILALFHCSCNQHGHRLLLLWINTACYSACCPLLQDTLQLPLTESIYMWVQSPYCNCLCTAVLYRCHSQ